MCRMANTIPLIFLMLMIASLAFGQDAQPRHPSPEDAFSTRELIAWSYLQTPQPAPKPLPIPDTQVTRGDQQRASQPDVQLFIGKVVREPGAYTLRASSSIYVLDGNIDPQAENQSVQILGRQDEKGSAIIHVLRIERLP